MATYRTRLLAICQGAARRSLCAAPAPSRAGPRVRQRCTALVLWCVCCAWRRRLWSPRLLQAPFWIPSQARGLARVQHVLASQYDISGQQHISSQNTASTTHQHDKPHACPAPAGSLEGRLLLRSLPSLPSLPRPGDVAATELLAPSMFPLKAVATVAQAAAAPAAAAAAQPGAGAGTGAQPGAGRQAQFGEQAPMQRRGFWGRLLARAARQQRQEPPVELLIRVEGRGLSNVTKAWIEGVPLALPPAPMPADGSGAEHSGGGGDKAAAAAGKPAATVAEVTIVQQPAAPLLPPPRERPLLPVFSQLSAVASW